MSKRVALTGNEAVAKAMQQINPDVVAAYPITPQTEIVQIFSKYVADGQVETEFVTVESEHSAMSACVGAAAGGARSMTATSANGLALMWEIVYIAASTRLPIVMPVVNRALSAPINIHCDHSDAMGARDSGWIQLFSENAQEAYDNAIQAVRIGESKDVLLPVMVNLDGFIISHAVENFNINDTEEVQKFIGEYKAEHHLLDKDNPITVGPLDLQDFYFEHKRQQSEAMKYAKEAVKKIGKEYGELTGREYGYFTGYRLEDAEIVLIGMGSTMGTAQAAVDELREQGKKVGLLKLRMFRPFPAEELAEALAHVPVIGVLDRAETFSTNGGPLFTDMHYALYGQEHKLIDFIYGLGGRDTNVSHIKGIFEMLQKAKDGQPIDRINYIGVRE